MKRLCFSTILVILTGCHVSDIPFIGWRIDVARQRKAYHHERFGEDPKTSQEQLIDDCLEHKKNHEEQKSIPCPIVRGRGEDGLAASLSTRGRPPNDKE